jgi:hypothetical protein
MKHLPHILPITLFYAFLLLFQQEGKTQEKAKKKKCFTETLWVNSDCDLCKTCIEKACDLRGIRNAEYNKGEFLLRVTYQPVSTHFKTTQKH